MYVNGSANLLNIILTMVLGLGISVFPELGIVGVGAATAISRSYEAVAITAVIASGWTSLSFTHPWNGSITRQIIRVSLPKFAEGMSTSIVSFPFNALLLLFGTEVSAAFHIARRIFHQFAGPLYRSLGTVTSIIIGQTLGKADEEGAQFTGLAISGLSILTLGSVAIAMIGGAGELARLFTQDQETVEHATAFLRVYGVAMVFFGIFYTFAGVLQGAGDTRTPFYARFVGEFGFMLGFSYVVGFLLNFGLQGVYLGMILTHVCRAIIVSYGFYYGDWINNAATMIAERAEESKNE
jgi:Na+-driven multidrug efflux pump